MRQRQQPWRPQPIAVLRVVVLLGAVVVLLVAIIPGRELAEDYWGEAMGAPDVPVPREARVLELARDGPESREVWSLPAQDVERLFRHYDDAMAERGWEGGTRPPGQHDWTYRKGERSCRIAVYEVRFEGTRLLVVVTGVQ